MTQTWPELVSIIIGVSGAYFLFSEVRMAQTVERDTIKIDILRRDFSETTAVVDAYNSNNKREFLILSAMMGNNWDRAKAEKLFHGSTDEDIESVFALGKKQYNLDEQYDKLQKARERIDLLYVKRERLVLPHALEFRQRSLLAGFLLIVLSAVIQVAVIVLK